MDFYYTATQSYLLAGPDEFMAVPMPPMPKSWYQEKDQRPLNTRAKVAVKHKEEKNNTTDLDYVYAFANVLPPELASEVAKTNFETIF